MNRILRFSTWIATLPPGSIAKLLFVVFCCFMIPVGRAGDCYLRENNDAFEMGNDYCSLTFRTRGGACTSYIYRGREFSAGNGMFEDLFWETPNYSLGEFIDVNYTTEKLQEDADRVTLHLWAYGSGNMRMIRYSKKFTLSRDSSLLKVEYEISNLPEAMGSYELTPWIHNCWNLAGDKNTHYLPTENGIITFPGEKPESGEQIFTRNASRGWIGVLGEKSRTGLAAIIDFRYLKQFYHCFCGTFTTAEWMLGPVSIPNGGSFKTAFYYLPFEGLSYLSGATSAGAGCLTLLSGNQQVAVDVAVPDSGVLQVILQHRRLPGKDWTIAGKQTMEMKADSSKRLTFPVNLEGEGTHVIQCRFLDTNANEVLQIEQPFSIGVPSGYFKQLPLEEKLIKEQLKYAPLSLKEDIVTPHITFGKPSAIGKLCTLFLIDAFRLREVVELAQRMDLDFVTPTLKAGSFWAVGWAEAGNGWSDGMREMQPLLQKQYDAILLSGWHSKDKEWPAMVHTLEEQIVSLVEKGIGLVYVHPGSPQGKIKTLLEAAVAIPSAHPLLSGGYLPPGISAAGIRIAEHGKGRIVFLDYPGNPIVPKKLPAEQADDAYAFINRALLWAARRDMPVEIVRCETQDHELKMAVKTLHDSPPASAQIVIRDRNSAKKEASFSWLLQSDANLQTFSCPLPDLKHGEHLLTLHLMDTQNRVLNWKTIQLNTTSKVTVAFMKLASNFRKVGENVEADIRLETAGSEKLPVIMTARWWDVYGRLAGCQNQELTVSAPGVDRKICLPLTHSYSAFNQLEVTVTTEAGVVYDTALEPFFIAVNTEKRWDNYPVLMWHEGYFQHEYAMSALKNMGVDSLFCYQPDKTLLAGLNFHGIGIYRQHLADKDFEEACKTMIRKPCMRVPAYRNILKKSMNGTAAAWAKFSPLFYSIGDENSLTGYENQCDICISQYCLPAFRDWLLQEYGSLEAINAAWDSSFESVDTLLPLNISQARERQNQNFAPWADHRSFMDTVFSDTMMFCRNEMKKFDPDTPVGECGTSRDAAYGGWDWYKRLQVWEALGPYSVYGDQLQIQRSFTDVPFAGYSGYRDSKFGLYCNWWWALLNGENGISLWYTPLFLNPDFTSTLMGEAIEEYAKGELKKGIGKLVSKSRLLRDGIAIHYSQASLQCAYILQTLCDGNTLKEYYDNRHQWLTLLTNNGLRGRFIASEQIENGDLGNAEYRLLLLPLSWALSDQEAENVRRFVNNGGIVIADRSTGLFDQHLKKRATGVLDDLFGIIKRLPGELPAQSLELSWRDHKILLDSCEAIQVVDNIEHGTIASRGKALGDYQINFGNREECYAGMVVHKIGKGKAIYLNVQPNSLKQITNLLMSIVSEEAAVKPQVVVAKDGNIVPGLEISRFQCGDIELLGIMQMPAAIGINPKTVTKAEMLALGYPTDISFMQPAHLYDVRKGHYLGFGSSCQQKIAPGETLLIALSPYRIEKVDIKLTRNQLKAGEKVEIQIARTPARGAGVIRIEVFAPQGKLSESYTENPSLQKGIADLALHTAINDPVGKWTIVAKDIISGLAVETSFELQQ